MTRVAVTLAALAAAAIAVTAGPVAKVGAPTPGGAHPILARDDTPPTNSQLLNDCPDGATHNADACTFEPDGNTQDVYAYATTNAEKNCDGGTTPFSRGFTFSKTVGSTYSIGASAGVSGDGGEEIPVGISIKTEATYSTDTSSTQTVDETDTVNPGKQTAILIQQKYTRHTGRLRVNYGSTVAGHYIWYVNGFNNDVPNGDSQNVLREFGCDQNIQSEVANYNADFGTAQI